MLPVNNKLVKGTDPEVPEIIGDMNETGTDEAVRTVTINETVTVTAVATKKAESRTDGHTPTLLMTLDHQIMTDDTTARSQGRRHKISTRPKSRSA